MPDGPTSEPGDIDARLSRLEQRLDEISAKLPGPGGQPPVYHHDVHHYVHVGTAHHPCWVSPPSHVECWAGTSPGQYPCWAAPGAHTACWSADASGHNWPPSWAGPAAHVECWAATACWASGRPTHHPCWVGPAAHVECWAATAGAATAGTPPTACWYRGDTAGAEVECWYGGSRSETTSGSGSPEAAGEGGPATGAG